MDKLTQIQSGILAQINTLFEGLITPETALQMMQYCDTNGYVDVRRHCNTLKAMFQGKWDKHGSKITLEEAQPLALRRSKAMFEYWNDLRQVLDRHEEVIRKRWLKKSREQRINIIKAAWNRPMATTHRPDFVALRKGGQSKFLDAYMWPYINQEDLVRGKTLLAFINSRGRHAPDLFIHADFKATHLGRLYGPIKWDPSVDLATVFMGRQTPETYGEIVRWEDEPKAMDWVSSRIGFTPSSGLLILQIRRKS